MLQANLNDIKILKPNCGVKCKLCKKQNVFYSILNGQFIYYCHTCKKDVTEELAKNALEIEKLTKKIN